MTDHLVVHPRRHGQPQNPLRSGQSRLERIGVEQAERDVHGGGGHTVPVVRHLARVDHHPQLDVLLGRRRRVVPGQATRQRERQAFDQGGLGHLGGHQHQCPVAAILAVAVVPPHPGVGERGPQRLVHAVADADLVLPRPAGVAEPFHVDRDDRSVLCRGDDRHSKRLYRLSDQRTASNDAYGA
ncbi:MULTISPECIES: hypothetical protein [unclassified Saccharothrix]|uniref:hypothetical protein n=1 Tax=unclassified Saccharothrix TaxID=2593673 RepID=UPI00307E0617